MRRKLLLILFSLVIALVSFVGCAGDPIPGPLYIETLYTWNGTAWQNIVGGGVSVEIDPLWSASPSFGITAGNIAGWDGHPALTTGTHGVAGTIVGTSDAQDLTNKGITMNNNEPIFWEDTLGAAVEVFNVWLDNNLSILEGESSNIFVWLSSGTGKTITFWPTGSTAVNTLRDSPTISLLANYWDTLNKNWAANIIHNMVTAGAAPKSRLEFIINGTDAFRMESDNGTITNYSDGALSVAEDLSVGANPAPWPLADGSGYFDSTLIARSEHGGSGLLVFGHNAIAAEHIGTGSFDYTGGAYENLFTATAAVFEQEDADKENWIVIASGVYAGTTAHIDTYISTTQVTLHTHNWAWDLAGVIFVVMPQPQFSVNAGGHTHIDTKTSGDLHIHSYEYTGECVVGVEADVAVDDMSAICVDVEANGYSASEAFRVRYDTGDIQPGDHTSVIKVSVDETGANSSDSTTEVDFINILTTDENDLEKRAIHVGQSFDSAFIVSGGTEEDPDYGYSVVPDVATDRVTGAPGAGTAFLESSGSDVQIFSADNDYILIGSDATFEAVDAILNTPANVDIEEEYYYSTGAGTWAALIVSDTMYGFRRSGTITFNAPAAWALSNATVPAGAAITNAYYVKIIRTRNYVGSPPVEDYFKTYTSSSTTDFEIRGDGTIRPVEMADASAPNNSLYYSTTQSKLVYKDSAGVANALY